MIILQKLFLNSIERGGLIKLIRLSRRGAANNFTAKEIAHIRRDAANYIANNYTVSPITQEALRKRGFDVKKFLDEIKRKQNQKGSIPPSIRKKVRTEKKIKEMFADDAAKEEELNKINDKIYNLTNSGEKLSPNYGFQEYSKQKINQDARLLERIKKDRRLKNVKLEEGCENQYLSETNTIGYNSTTSAHDFAHEAGHALDVVQPSPRVTGETGFIVTPTTLAEEAYASHKAMALLKKHGATKKQLKRARKNLHNSYQTYNKSFEHYIKTKYPNLKI